MGHQRLGTIPTTVKWVSVVRAVVGNGVPITADVATIAARTVDAANAALQSSVRDLGLKYTFYLLTQVVLATRHEDWEQRLAALGIPLGANPSLFDLTSGMQLAIDRFLAKEGRVTDVSEMAQQAAGEALTSLALDRSVSLFGSGAAEVRAAVRGLSTEAGFASLGQAFFGRFLTRFLNFYLSRITARHASTARVGGVAGLSEFNGTLQTHCHESALIVRDYCGQWYSKTQFREGIDRRNASRFMAKAVRKLVAELARQGAAR